MTTRGSSLFTNDPAATWPQTPKSFSVFKFEITTAFWFINLKETDMSDNWEVVEWSEWEEPLLNNLDLKIAVVSQWLRTNARTAVWSNMLLWLKKQWKAIRAIESRLKTSPRAVNNKARQWGNRRLRLSGELEDTGYEWLASKTSIRGNAELCKVPYHQG